jgi:hypothetical protein
MRVNANTLDCHRLKNITKRLGNKFFKVATIFRRSYRQNWLFYSQDGPTYMGVWQWPALGFEEKENEKNNTHKKTYIDQCYRL